MTPPGEIVMMNREGKIFRAHVCERRNPVTNEQEWLFNPIKRTFQYRVHIPGVELSLVVIDVTRQQLRDHIRTSIPIPIIPHAA